MSQVDQRKESTVSPLQRGPEYPPPVDVNAEPLFTGNAPMGAQAVALYRYCRTMEAMGAYDEPSNIHVVIRQRMRWTVGMHCELGHLRDAIGSLVMQGCTGGTFLMCKVPALYEWVDFEGPYMLVNFDRRPLNVECPTALWDNKYEPYLSRHEDGREQWWLWNDFLPCTHASRPPWWNSRTKDDAKICMPSVWISRSYMEKVLAQIADSKKLFVDSRKVIEEMYGPPPNSKDFQSDTLVL